LIQGSLSEFSDYEIYIYILVFSKSKQNDGFSFFYLYISFYLISLIGCFRLKVIIFFLLNFRVVFFHLFLDWKLKGYLILDIGSVCLLLNWQNQICVNGYPSTRFGFFLLVTWSDLAS
jgi:hypothetical protein